jgi:hypothetical protein
MNSTHRSILARSLMAGAASLAFMIVALIESWGAHTMGEDMSIAGAGRKPLKGGAQ